MIAVANALDARDVERMLGAGRAAAEAEGAALCIAVVDHAGSLAGFLRMPGAFFISTDLAVDKAWSAAGMKMSTEALGDLLAGEADIVRDGLLRQPRLTDVPGGVPLLSDGAVTGAVGVSGGSAQQDVRSADAAIAAYWEGRS